MYFRPFIETPFHPIYNDCFGSHLVLYSSWSYDHSGGMIIQIENKIGRLHQKLVGGFNPFEKYARQNGNLPQIAVEKNLKPPPRKSLKTSVAMPVGHRRDRHAGSRCDYGCRGSPKGTCCHEDEELVQGGTLSIINGLWEWHVFLG